MKPFIAGAMILAGTSDARELVLQAAERGLKPLVCVVTNEGAAYYKEHNIDVHIGRLTGEMMAKLIQKEKLDLLIDATHPFAEIASTEAIRAAHQAGVPCLRYERPISPQLDNTDNRDHMIFSAQDAAEAAGLIFQKKDLGFTKEQPLCVLLATGAKTLPIYAALSAKHPEVRLMVRLLPRRENFELCEKLGIPPENIIAMQGPFSEEFNRALMQNCQVDLLVTKESGSRGFTSEKIRAAASLKIPVIVINRPKVEYENLYHSTVETIERAVALAGATAPDDGAI